MTPPQQPTTSTVVWVRLLILVALGLGMGRPAYSQATAPAAPLPPRFLTPAEAAAVLGQDQDDPYYARLQPLEMSAKTGAPITGATLAEQREECRRRYAAGVQAFTAEEKAALTITVKQIQALLAQDYPLLTATPFCFLKVNETVEGGLPHTRGDCIVLPERFLARPPSHVAGPAAKPDEAAWLRMLGPLLVHEQLHVVQRRHPQPFARLYTQTWGFVYAKRVQSCAYLDEHQVINPDGPDLRWVFPIPAQGGKRYLWPLVLLAESKPDKPLPPVRRMGQDMRMAAVELEATGDGEFQVKVDGDGRPMMRDLLEVAEYRRVFEGSSYIFHPHEAAADLFGKAVSFSLFTQREQMPAERWERIAARAERVRKLFVECLAKSD